ncbi:MAG TPA: hypothetical protein VNE39_12185 [Planctomycetota bacterium]|nr:hypothetical protein [Planctomycetota bacterium]
MRRLLWLCAVLGAGASVALAAAPPHRHDQGGRPDRGGERIWPTFTPGGPQRGKANPFDALRRYFDLTPEQQAAVAKLDEQRSAEEREAIAEITKTYDKKFAALLVEVLPADQKAKYEQVIAALTARDDAVEAAQKELRDTIEQVRTAQGIAGTRRWSGAYLPLSKGDVIRQCINLTEQQRQAMDGVTRDGWTAMRDKMRDVPRPQDWRDADARQKYSDAMRKVREQVDAQSAEAMALLLNDEQKKAYQTVATALDTCNKKIAEADDACEKKLIELVGAEKAKALRAGWWQVPPIVQPGGPGDPPPKGAEAPKATEF